MARIGLIDAALAVELLTATDALYFDLQHGFLCVTKPGRALAITGFSECSWSRRDRSNSFRPEGSTQPYDALQRSVAGV